MGIARPMRWCCCLLLAAAAAAQEQNLLANPGFEELIGDRPVRWDCYIMPQPGAVGRLDNTPHSGLYSVMLHTPTPYARDPVNNWSQNVIAELGAKSLRASAFVRTDDVTEAAIWLQAWQRRPARVLAVASSSREAAVYGTRDWEAIEVTMDAPAGTDFVTLRCVIIGTGTAWFDDIEFAAAKKEEGIAGTADEMEQEAPEAQTPPKDTPPLPDPPVPAMPAEVSDAVGRVRNIEGELTSLRTANQLLADSVQAMQETNEALLSEVLRLRAAMDSLRLRAGDTAGPGPPVVASSAIAPADRPPARVPPLVPHGYDWRSLL